MEVAAESLRRAPAGLDGGLHARALDGGAMTGQGLVVDSGWMAL